MITLGGLWMFGWKIDEKPEAFLQLLKAPNKIQKKYGLWKASVKTSGPFLLGSGWRTEKLSGRLKKFYSARLDRKWRVIFEIEGKDKTIAILRVTQHLYSEIKR
jgi:Txe/YoeB family toxin of Txe-Axe toxin-antitoxin module